VPFTQEEIRSTSAGRLAVRIDSAIAAMEVPGELQRRARMTAVGIEAMEEEEQGSDLDREIFSSSLVRTRRSRDEDTKATMFDLGSGPADRIYTLIGAGSALFRFFGLSPLPPDSLQQRGRVV